MHENKRIKELIDKQKKEAEKESKQKEKEIKELFSTKRRLHLNINGKVQGVFFREYIKQKAEQEGLTWWVRNIHGNVEVVAEGDKEALYKFLEACKQGPPAAEVDFVEVEWENPQGKFSWFEIRR